MSETTTPNQETPAAPAPNKNIFYETLFGAAHDQPPKPAELAAEPKPVEVKAEPTPEPPKPVVKKKVVVREPEPEPANQAPAVDPRQVEELVRLEVERRVPAQKVDETPFQPPVPLPEGLSEEEIEEIELARYAEETDPTKRGLADQVVKFHIENKKFLEQALDNDPDFDPSTDPEYKKFLAKNEPKFSASEKRKALIKRETDAAELRAAERVRRELAPEIEANRAQLREIQARPEVVKKVNEISSNIFKDVEDEAFKAFAEKGEAAGEDFPIETEILNAEKQKTVRLAEEFLAIRSGLKPFSAAENQAHKEISDFINAQGDAFLKHGGKHLVRDGKQFVPPAQWKASMANTHWTFSNDDVVTALQVEAARRAKTRIKIEHGKIEKALAAKAKRTSPAPISATPAPTEEVSPRAAAATAPSVKPKKGNNIYAQILGY